MTDVVTHIKQSLQGIYPEAEAKSLCRIVVEEVTGASYFQLLADKFSKITDSQAEEIKNIINRLKQHEPIQYILGRAEFCGMPFFVDRNVLIPRPETEELVELVCTQNKQKNLSVLDVGAGSACIAISLAKLMDSPKVSAWDVSASALRVAGVNAKKLSAEIYFQEVDVLKDVPTNQTFDIIVSNPPYVLDSDKKEMDENVLEYEPHTALFVPDDKALMFYERIADISLNLLNNDGKLYFEIHHKKGVDTVKLMRNRGYSNVVLYKDMSGLDRMVCGTMKRKV